MNEPVEPSAEDRDGHSLLRDLAAFRRALCGAGEAPGTGEGHPFAAVTERGGPGGAAGALSLDLSEPAPLTALEAELGAARRLPRSGPGRAMRWLFPDTLPPDGQSGATVLAETDEDGATVVRLLLRRDDDG